MVSSLLRYQLSSTESILIDVIGVVGKVGGINYTKSTPPKKYIVVDILDLNGNMIPCTLWDKYADEVIEYWKSKPVGCTVLIIQFAIITEWQGVARLSNSFYTSKLFIGSDIDEINTFKARIPIGDDSSTNCFTGLDSDELQLDGNNEFKVKQHMKVVADLRNCEKDSYCIVYAKIIQLETKYNWYYLACKKCNRKVYEEGRLFNCKHCKSYVNDVYPSFKVHLLIMDDTGSDSKFFFFEKPAFEILGKSAAQLKSALERDGDEDLFPEELNNFLDLELLFKLHITEYSLGASDRCFSVVKTTADPDLIANYLNHVTAHEASSLSFLDNIHGKIEGKSAKRALSLNTPIDVDEDNGIPQEAGSSTAQKIKDCES